MFCFCVFTLILFTIFGIRKPERRYLASYMPICTIFTFCLHVLKCFIFIILRLLVIEGGWGKRRLQWSCGKLLPFVVSVLKGGRHFQSVVEIEVKFSALAVYCILTFCCFDMTFIAVTIKPIFNCRFKPIKMMFNSLSSWQRRSNISIFFLVTTT